VKGDDLFAAEKPWRPAREIIDWSIKGGSIFNRKKPLAAKTLARIHAGAVKFGWPEPFLVILRNHMAGQSVEQPLPTIAANGTHIGLAEPVPTVMPARNLAHAAKLIADDINARFAEPIIMNGRKGNKAEGVSEGLIPTLDTKGGVWLAEPLVLSQHNSGAARSAEEPLPTITTGGAANPEHPGCARPMLVEPFILNRHGEGYGETRAHSIDDPTPTANCRGAGYIIEPFVLSQASGGSPRAVSEPIPTQTTGGNGASHALISPYYGSGSGETCNSVEESLPTITSKARFGMVVPVTNSNGGAQPRDIDVDPLATMTTAKGGEFAIVLPVTHAGGHDRALNPADTPLPTVTGANRGELAFITAQHGERQGQAPRVHDIDQPAPSIAATGHVDLVQATPHYDILFRMLEPHELAAAMGFNTDESTYEFAGTKTEKIKQIGNAVSVSKMKACVGALMADAAPKRKPALEDGYLEAAE